MTAVYWDGEKKQYNVKRFVPEESQKPVVFITDHEDSYLEFATTHPAPKVVLQFDRRSNDLDDETIDLVEFITVKGVTAKGNRLTPHKVKAMDRLEEEIEEVEEEETEAPEEAKAEVTPEENPTTEAGDDAEKESDPGKGTAGGGQGTLF